jgi:hypothetical protein
MSQRSSAHRRPRLHAGLYWAPGHLHGLETIMALAPNGEMTFRTIEPGTAGDTEIGQLEDWLKERGVADPSLGPTLFVF